MPARPLRLRRAVWDRAAHLARILASNHELRLALGGAVESPDVLRIAVERGLEDLEHKHLAPAPTPELHLGDPGDTEE